MMSDRFSKIMLVLIFLALIANLFKSTVIGELVYAYTKPMLPIEQVQVRLRKMEYLNHYHKFTCDCSSLFLKNGVSKEMKSSLPVSSIGEDDEATTF